MQEIRLSAGMYPVREAFAAAPEATLAQLRQFGYQGVELYGLPSLPPETVARLCRENQLVISGCQVSWRYLQGESLEQVIQTLQAMSVTNLIITALGGPWESGHRQMDNTIVTWQKHAARMNELAERLAEVDMTITYHTHDYDFGELIEGKITSFELLKQETSQQVGIEVDTGSCLKGGKLPEAEILSLDSRARLIHCKPYSTESDFEVALGSQHDTNHWLEIYAAAKAVSTEWLVIEPEAESLGDTMSLMKYSLASLKLFI